MGNSFAERYLALKAKRDEEEKSSSRSTNNSASHSTAQEQNRTTSTGNTAANSFASRYLELKNGTSGPKYVGEDTARNATENAAANQQVSRTASQVQSAASETNSRIETLKNERQTLLENRDAARWASHPDAGKIDQQVANIDANIAALERDAERLQTELTRPAGTASAESADTKSFVDTANAQIEALKDERQELMLRRNAYNAMAGRGQGSTVVTGAEEGAAEIDRRVAEIDASIAELESGLSALGQSNEKNASGWEIAGNAALSGLGQFNKGIFSTLDLLLPTDFLGEYDPFSRLNEYYSGVAEEQSQNLQESVADRGTGWQIGAEVIAGTTAAIPNALLAVLSGGTSVGAQALTTASTSSSALTAASTAVQQMARNPMYWTSFAQTLGNDYEEAKENGASDVEAALTATLSSLINAGVEIGGGLETLPDALRGGDTSAIRQWVRSALEEGKEEVVQGVISGLTENVVYDHDKEMFSLTDEDAVFNPGRMAKEYGMGAAVGGILGGAQTGAVSAWNSAANAANNRALANEGSNYREATQELIDEGLASRPGTDSLRMAQELQARMDAGEDVSDADLGRLVHANQRAFQQEAANEAYEESRARARETPAQEQRAAQEAASEATEAAENVPYNVLNRQQARRTAPKDLGYGERGTQAISDIVETTGQSVEQVQTEFQSAYEAGLTNLPRDRVTLISDVQETAYNAGRQDAILSMKKAETRGATVWGRAGGLIENDYSAQLDAQTRDTLNTVGKATGTKVVIDAQVGGGMANGSYVDTDGTIHIAADAENPVMVVLKHELTHRMQNLAPAEYVKFRDYAVQVQSEGRVGNTLVAEYQRNIERLSGGRVILSAEQAMDEIAADFTEKILSDEKALNDFVNHAAQSTDTRTMAQKFFDAVREFIDKVRKAFGGNRAKMDAAARAQYGATIEQLEKAERLWKDAYRAAEKRVETGGQQEYTGGTETQHSAKKYWRPDLTKAEWSLLNHRMEMEIGDPAFDIDEATKWVYADTKGTAVFAIYGVGDGTEATPLYASGGKKARADNAKWQKFLEGFDNEPDTDRTEFDSWVKSVRGEKGNGGGNLHDAADRGPDAGTRRVHDQAQGSNGGRSAGAGPENRGEQFRLKAETAKQLDSRGLTVQSGVIVSKENAALMRQEGYFSPVDRDIVRYSIKTEPAWRANYLATHKGADAERVANVLKSYTERMIQNDAIFNYVPNGDYNYSKFGPLRDNMEYIFTFDMDTSCPRTFQFLNYRNALRRIAGRELTYNESVNLLELMRAYGQQIPCAYCYVENKRILLSASYNNFFNFRQGVMSAATDAEALTKMYSYDPKKGKVSSAAQKVFDRWRSDTSYNPSVTEVWTATNEARNAVLNFLDAERKAGRATPNGSMKALQNKVYDRFSVTDAKSAEALEIEGFINDWVYDTKAKVEHIYNTPNSGKVPKAIDLRALRLNREALAYSKSASSAKTVENYTPYTDQLKNVSKEDRDYILGMGGIRKHSSNDFRVDYVQDYFLFYADLAAGKWTGHTYTKSVDFAKIFGRTGDRINMSVAFYGDTKETLRQNIDEGAPWRDVKEIRKHYKDVGSMAMVTSDAQLTYALNADWIDMIIPFHASGLDKAVWYDLRMWNDYTSKQSERFKNADDMRAELSAAGIAFDKKATADDIRTLYNESFGIKQIFTYDKDGTLKVDAKGNPVLHKPHFFPGDTYVDGQLVPGHGNDAQRYFELCQEYGVHPRFKGVKVEDAKGRRMDVTEHPNYIKLIKETSRVDSEQRPIEFNLDQHDDFLGMSPMEYAFKRMEEEAKNGGFENTKADPYGIVKEFSEQYLGKDRPLGYLTERAKTTRDIINEGYQEMAYSEDERVNAVEPGTTQEQAELSDANTQWSLRKKAPPEKTGIAYKVFLAKDGQLYPPMVANPGGEGTPVGVWLDADAAPLAGTSKTGRPQVQAGGKGTNAGKMQLAYRPGWHLGDVPQATQFAKLNPETGVKELFPANFVWCECEYAMDVDYQEEAMSYGYTENGKFRHSYAGLPRLPEDGYYRYRTNPKPDTVPWVITGAMRVTRIMTDAETDQLVRAAGMEPMKRQGGPIDLEQFGLKAGDVTGGEQFSLKGQADLLKQNEQLKETVAALQEQFKLTEFAKVDKKALDNFTKKLLKDYESGADINETRDALDDLYTYIANGEDGHGPAWNTAYRMAYDTAQTILENAVVLDDSDYRDHKALRDALRNTGITLDKSYEHDLGGYESLNEFRKANFGRIKLVKDGVPVGRFYQELEGQYPWLFDADQHTNQADQLLHIAEVLDGLQPTEYNPYSGDMRSAATWLANDIMDRFMEMPQAKPTFADKANRKLTEQAIKDAKKLERLREQKNKRIADLIAKNREKVKQTTQKERQKRAEAVERVKEHYKAKETTASERRKASMWRKKIAKHVETISRMLNKGTDTSHVPEEMRKPVAEFLSAIDLTTPRQKDATINRLNELRTLYKRIADNETDLNIEVDPDLAANLDTVMAALKRGGDTVTVADLNNQDLEALYRATLAVERSIYMHNRAMAEGKTAQISELARNVMAETAARTGYKEHGRYIQFAADMLNMDMLNPQDYFIQLGKTMNDLFHSIREGFDSKIRRLAQAQKYIAGLTEGVDVKALSDKKAVAREFKVQSGQTIRLTPAQVMSLYLLQRQPDALNHIYEGGIKPAPVVAMDGKSRRPKVVRSYDVVKVTPEDVSNILASMTPEQKKLAEGIGKFFTEHTAEWGNEVSMALYGYRKFTVENYFPIVSDKNYLKEVFGETNDATLKNMGVTKGRIKGANNPIIIEDVFDVFTRQTDQMSSYNAFVIPLSDIQRVYNFKTSEGSVKQSIEKRYGVRAVQYFSKLMTDINGGARWNGGSQFLNDLISRYKQAKMGLNLRVVLQQPSAMLRAQAVIDGKYLVRAMTHKSTADMETIYKYAPVAQWKQWGFFSMDTGKQMKDVILENKNLSDYTMWMAGKMDEITWKRLWVAAEMEIQDKQSNLQAGSDEYYTEVGQRFSEIIDRTQVVDSVLHRSQMMRNPDTLVKMSVSFMNEPFKAYNMLRTAIAQAKNNPSKATKQALAAAGFAYVSTLIVNHLITAVVDTLRGDEDDEEWLEEIFNGIIGKEDTEEPKSWQHRFLWQFLDNVVNEPLSMFPFVKDVVSMVQGFDVKRMDMQGVGDLVNAMTRGLSDKYTIQQKVIDIGSKLGDLLGVPVSSLKRELETITKHVIGAADSPMIEYQADKALYTIAGNKARYLDILYRAYEQGDMEAYNQIVMDMIEAGVTPASIESGMRSRAKKAGVSVDDMGGNLFMVGIEPKYEIEAAEGNEFTVDDLSGADYTEYIEYRGDLLEQIVDDFNRRGFGSLDEESANNLLNAAYTYVENTALLGASGGSLVVVTGEDDKETTYLEVDGVRYDYDAPAWVGKAENADDLGLTVSEYLWLRNEYNSDIGADGVYEAYEAGIDVETYLEFKDATRDIVAERDANGNPIAGSKKEQIMDYMDTMGLTQEEYNALLEIAGYKVDEESRFGSSRFSGSRFGESRFGESRFD